MNGWNAGIVKMISYQKSTKIRTPYRYNMDIQSLRAGFTEGGGDIIALVENGGELQWNLVDLELCDKRIIQNFCHAAIGSLTTSALAALLNIYTRPRYYPSSF